MPHELPASNGRVSNEIERLRAAQAKAVIPLIGPLLDAFDAIPNDVLGMDELEGLCAAIEAINHAMENAE